MARELPAGPQREPALADSARPNQRDRVREGQQPLELRQLPPASDEATQLDREVVRRRLDEQVGHGPGGPATSRPVDAIPLAAPAPGLCAAPRRIRGRARHGLWTCTLCSCAGGRRPTSSRPWRSPGARARRGAASVDPTSRSCSASTTSSAGWTGPDPVPAVRERDLRAGLEPELDLVRSDHRWQRRSVSTTAVTSRTRQHDRPASYPAPKRICGPNWAPRPVGQTIPQKPKSRD
jgi:hypothetical protein